MAISSYMDPDIDRDRDSEDEAKKRAALAEQTGAAWDDIDKAIDAAKASTPDPQPAPPPPAPTKHVPVPGVDYDPAGHGPITTGDLVMGALRADRERAQPFWDAVGGAAKDAALSVGTAGTYSLKKAADEWNRPADPAPTPLAAAAAASNPAAPSTPAPPTPAGPKPPIELTGPGADYHFDGFGRRVPNAPDIPPLMKAHGDSGATATSPTPPPPPQKHTGPGWGDDPRVTGPGSALAAGAYHDAPLPAADAYSLNDIASRNRAADVINREYLTNLADIDQQDRARTAVAGGSPIELAIEAQKKSQAFEEGQPYGSQSMLRYDTGDGKGMQDAPQTLFAPTIEHAMEMGDKLDLLHAQQVGKDPYLGFKNIGEMRQYFLHANQINDLNAKDADLLSKGAPPEEVKRIRESAELRYALQEALRSGNYQAYAALLQAKNNPNALMMVPSADK